MQIEDVVETVKEIQLFRITKDLQCFLLKDDVQESRVQMHCTSEKDQLLEKTLKRRKYILKRMRHEVLKRHFENKKIVSQIEDAVVGEKSFLNQIRKRDCTDHATKFICKAFKWSLNHAGRLEK